ncbi:MAG: type II toxin-antitoxin system HicA family toxin [Bacteroidales bacterium]|nr:type II toxin-antitoxin system HicA family toxin [Bacteroidales bacterium]
MKYSELHRLLRANGWVLDPTKGKGGHRVYVKEGISYVVPYHGAKEIGNDFARRILKEMGIG